MFQAALQSLETVGMKAKSGEDWPLVDLGNICVLLNPTRRLALHAPGQQAAKAILLELDRVAGWTHPGVELASEI
jgi:hypothetical protein